MADIINFSKTDDSTRLAILSYIKNNTHYEIERCIAKILIVGIIKNRINGTKSKKKNIDKNKL